MKEGSLTRRRFLQGAASTLALPAIIPASALGRSALPPPSERIVLGCIGTGYQGTRNMQAFLALNGAQVVAVCDVDSERRDAARKIVEETYAERTRSGSFKGCDTHNDFRELIARPDLDGVVVCTPDHWHAIASIQAMKAGKDVYCEKPLTLTISEGRAISDTARRYRRVFQTGSQLRSFGYVRYGCELVRNGRIGKVHTVYVDKHNNPTCPPQPEMPIPKGFDYDMWLGQAPWAPYTEKRCHWNYRYILDYSGGDMTDHGVHNLDVVQWALGQELSGPVEVEGEAEYPKSGLWNAPSKELRFEWRYADGVRMIGDSEKGKAGARFEGPEGWVTINQGGIDASPKTLLTSKIGPNEIHLYESPDHHQNFIDCIRTRGETVAPPEHGHRSATVPHLANIAFQLNRKLRWDPVIERFEGDEQANALLSRAMRSPWRL